jgi:hypothetical protein
VVYAHENAKVGEASSHYVTEIINWLNELRAPNLSDKFPLLRGSESDANPALNDILTSQIRLLPAYEGPDKVESIILCISPVLRSYYDDVFTRDYIDQIEQLYETREDMEKFERKVRNFVESQLKMDGFHHVLTEIAFLKIRSLHYGSDDCGIIPFMLDGGDLGIDFLSGLSVRVVPPSPAELGDRHESFFKLLEKLYPLASGDFRSCLEHYQTLRQWCGEDRHEMSPQEKVEHTIQRLLNDLTRLREGGVRDADWKGE